MLQDTELSRLKPGVAVETVHLSIQSGTATIVPVVDDADFLEVLPAEIEYNAPTPVSRERVAEVPDFLYVGPHNTVLPFVPQLLI